jgi:hypothetical protein
MYEQFKKERTEEEQQFGREVNVRVCVCVCVCVCTCVCLQEEWERALQDLTRKYNQPDETSKAKEELIRHLTIKRERRRETMQQRRKERERTKTAELVDVQAREMLELYKNARKVCVCRIFHCMYVPM